MLCLLGECGGDDAAPAEPDAMVSVPEPRPIWSMVIDQNGVSGPSPFSCTPIANPIVFINPELFGAEDYDICWTAADVMTFLDDCGDTKSFTDEDVACGEFEARNCCDNTATQNSFQKLIDAYGPAQ